MTRSAIAFLAAAAAAASLLFAARGGSPGNDDGGSLRRRLSSNIREFADPKSIVWKAPASSITEFFPFHVSASDRCIEKETIVGISRAVRSLLERGVRVFPRNGFLLGIVRHGGFLPNEHVDADLGIVSSDLERMNPKPNDRGGLSVKLPGFTLVLKRLRENFWQNWNGLNPASGEPYPFFGVVIHAKEAGIHLWANSVYPYRDTGTFFFPWVTSRRNHKASIVDGYRYNTEGGDLRLVDKDERLDPSNYQKGDQLGNVFDTDLTDFVEKQFYFTTIPVPRDYDKILTSLYGENWNHVNNRGDIENKNMKENIETTFSAHAVSDEENEKYLQGGPRPICMS